MFGWDQNSNVPDPLKELNCPLLYLASGFGKAGVVRGLLRNGFNPGVVNEHGETVLHAAVKHLHMYNNPMGKAFRKREDLFQHILLMLSTANPKILAAQDNKGRTALHVTAIASLDRSQPPCPIPCKAVLEYWVYFGWVNIDIVQGMGGGGEQKWVTKKQSFPRLLVRIVG